MIRKAKTLLNRFIPLISGSVIGLGMTMFMPSAGALAAGTPLYWCGAGNTSANATTGTVISAAANWDTVDSTTCGSISLVAPGPSNDLFFDNTNLTAAQSLSNPNALEVGSINFTGSGTTYSFTITGLLIKLDGTNSGSGITNTETASYYPFITADLILNASQSITTGRGLIVNNLDLGSNPLTVTGSYLKVNGNLSGTGNIAVNSTFADFVGASPIETCSYSGVVTITSLSSTLVY
jgi:hypothetical protein